MISFFLSRTLEQGFVIAPAICVAIIMSVMPTSSSNAIAAGRDKIIVAGEIDYPPYSFLDEKGEPTGFSVELTRSIANTMGMNIEISLTAWPVVRKAFDDGAIDVVPGMFYSEERTKVYDFSPPFCIISSAIFARKNAPAITSLEDLRNKEIVVMRGEVMYDYILEHGLTDKLLLTETPSDALRALASGKGDYALVAQMPGLYWIRELKLSNIRSVGPTLEPFKNCFVVKKGNAVLLSRFSEGLNILYQTGEYHRLYDKWLGILEPTRITPGLILKYASIVLVPLILLLSASLFWTWMLRSKVNQKTRELKESESMLRQILYTVPQSIFWKNKDGVYLGCNHAFARAVGLEGPEKIIGKTDFEMPWPNKEAEAYRADDAEVIITGKPKLHFQEPMQQADGVRLLVDTSKMPLLDEDEKIEGVLGIFEDITERVRQEHEIELVNRLYNVLSKVSQAVVQAKSAETFLTETCRIVVDDGGFLLSWIGQVEVETNAVVPIATWGTASDYVRGITVYADDRLEGRGPTGTCIRERRPSVHNDFIKSPITKPWRDRARPFGIHASAGFPIESIGRAWGALTIYSDKVGCFGEKDVKLLEKVAENIGFALDNFERERERSLAEDALRRKTEELAAVLDTLPALVWIGLDPECRVITGNRFVNDLFGVSTGTNVSQNMAENDQGVRIRHLKTDGTEYRAEELPMQRAIALGKPIDNVESIYALPDGKRVFSIGNAAPLFDDNGRVRGAVGAFLDITERKMMEDALLESESRAKAMLKAIPDLVFRMNNHGVFLDYRADKRDLFVQSEPTIIGKRNRDLVPPEFADLVDRQIRTTLETNELQTFEYQLPIPGRGVRDYEARMIPSGANEVTTIVRDMTEQKKAQEERLKIEERLRRSEKMEALGTLAGGVAHDLNNVLGIVVGYSELLLDDLDESSSVRSEAMEILKGGQRAAAIVQDLLTLARRGVQGRKVLNLNNLVKECQKTPEFFQVLSYHSKVLIKEDLEADLLNITGSFVHLTKSIFNLVLNASEAMPGGGSITIKTRNHYLDKPVWGYDEVKEGDYVILSISDTGDGIPASDLKRIFEPFYTKKVMGRSGTGLGLAVVWGTVKDHLGYINVESEEGRGTTFSLYFPVTRDELTPEQVSISASEYMGNGESILVVDDVREQRQLAMSMLKKLNYNVVDATSGEEAVKFVQENRVDLLVLDMIMDPGMDGLDTYRKILEIHPRQKAIIVSGFAETERVKEAQCLGAGAYVRKPYVLEKLGIAIKKEFDPQL